MNNNFILKKRINNLLAFAIVLIVTAISNYYFSGPSLGLNVLQSRLLTLAFFFSLLILVFIGDLLSYYRIKRWSQDKGYILIDWRGLAAYERPKEWNFITVEGDEVKSFAVKLQKSSGEICDVLICWHRTFGIAPQEIWLAKESS